MNNFSDHITHDFFAAYLSGKASEDQVIIVEQWINASAENKAYFESIKKTWEESGKLNPRPVLVDVDLAWNKLSSKIDAFEKDKKIISINRKPNHTYLRMMLRVAAVLIPIAIITIFYFWQTGKVKQINLVASERTIQETLPDGTAVTINTKSKLSYPQKFKGSTREVTLEGEAYFDVTHDKEKPFIIHTGEANIKVLGTSFNVNAYNDNNDVEVSVKEGKVLLYSIDKISGDTNSVLLAAGEKGIFDKITNKVLKIQEFNANDIFWKTKTLIFTKTELSMVIETLQKFYGVNIVFTNKELYNCRLSATFINQPIDNIIDIIAKSFNLVITKSGTTYNLDGKGC
jgi:ferric-dicitrate binding protein FerR (iron transport regulator)